MDIIKLHEMAFDVTAEIFTEEYSHLAEMWKVILGGYVLPKMAELDPGSVKNNPTFEALVSEYSKDKIASMYAPKTIEVVKEVEVIREIEVIKEVESPVLVTKPVMVLGNGVVHRRLRDNVNKLKRKEHDLVPAERDVVIKVFNSTQDMIDKRSSVFKSLVDAINAKRAPEDFISASQLSGYWSSLCRWADKSTTSREDWIEKSIKKGNFSVRPYYSDEFIAKIKANYLSRREEEAKRAADHAFMKRTGSKPTVVVPTPASKPFDLIDFADIC